MDMPEQRATPQAEPKYEMGDPVRVKPRGIGPWGGRVVLIVAIERRESGVFRYVIKDGKNRTFAFEDELEAYE